MKVSELEGVALRRWTALAAGYVGDNDNTWVHANGDHIWKSLWMPDIDWSQSGKLVDKYDIWFSSDEDHDGQKVHIASLPPHIASAPSYAYQEGTTKLVAACRAIIASVYGEEVEE